MITGPVWMPMGPDHLTGVNRARSARHAVEWTVVAHRGRRLTLPAVCGRLVYMEGVTVVNSSGERDGGMYLAWPPYQRADDLDRCRECWELTGKPRPAYCWKPGYFDTPLVSVGAQMVEAS